MMRTEYRYYYDDWSTEPPSSELRHQILIKYEYPSIRLREKFFVAHCKWLSENIGKVSKDWHFSLSTSTFYFKNMEDVMAFKLRWL